MHPLPPRWHDATPAEVAAAAGPLAAAQAYLGTDVWGRKTYGGGGWDSCKGVAAAVAAGVSSALFAPGWVYEFATPEEQRAQQFEPNNERFWQSIQLALASGRGYTPRAVATVLPLVTTFNKGCGSSYWLEGGEVGGGRPWFNMSCQDLMPHCSCSEGGSESGSPGHDSCSLSVTQRLAFTGGSCLELVGSWRRSGASAGLDRGRTPTHDGADAALLRQQQNRRLMQAEDGRGATPAVAAPSPAVAPLMLTHQLYRTNIELPAEGLLVTHATAAQRRCLVRAALWLQPSAAMDGGSGGGTKERLVVVGLDSEKSSSSCVHVASDALPGAPHHQQPAAASWVRTTYRLQTQQLLSEGYDTITAVGLAWSGLEAPAGRSAPDDVSCAPDDDDDGGYSALIGLLQVCSAEDARNAALPVRNLRCQLHHPPAAAAAPGTSISAEHSSSAAAPAGGPQQLSCDLKWDAPPDPAGLHRPVNRSYHIYSSSSSEGGKSGSSQRYVWLGECFVEQYRVACLELLPPGGMTARVQEDSMGIALPSAAAGAAGIQLSKSSSSSVTFHVQAVSVCGVVQPLHLAAAVTVPLRPSFDPAAATTLPSSSSCCCSVS